MVKGIVREVGRPIRHTTVVGGLSGMLGGQRPTGRGKTLYPMSGALPRTMKAY